MEIENPILQHVQNLVHDKNFRVERDTSLIAKGVLDSLDILDLIEFIESSFRIKLTGDDLNPDFFETVSTIVELVQKKLTKDGFIQGG